MTDQQKAAIVERVARKARLRPHWSVTMDTVEEVLDAADYWAVLEERNALRVALAELANAPVTFADDRVGYVEIQVVKADLTEAKKLLGGDT